MNQKWTFPTNISIGGMGPRISSEAETPPEEQILHGKRMTHPNPYGLSTSKMDLATRVFAQMIHIQEMTRRIRRYR